MYNEPDRDLVKIKLANAENLNIQAQCALAKGNVGGAEILAGDARFLIYEAECVLEQVLKLEREK